MPSSAPLVIGTAGHIDHGKTALVRALTGTNTDRLPEEQRRGITIELGFAHLTLPSRRKAAVVDVPGHERFVRHMVAGAQGVDLVLLVVAADDGVMEQTREHLEVCDLLGCTAGVVAITKCDLVDDDWLELVEGDVRDTLAPTFLAAAPIVRCSAATGAGLDALLATLDQVAATVAPRPADRSFRLPIDRCFTLHGFGTVATGTVADGTVAVGDRLLCLPGGVEARVRTLQRHGLPVKRLTAGTRAAVNLAGVVPEAVGRGSWLCHADTYAAATRLTAEITTLGRTAPPLTSRLPLRLHLGAGDLPCRLHPLEGREVAPGETALAQLFVAGGVIAMPGDRFVLRTPSPAATVGGGRILAVGGRRLRRRPGLGEQLRPLTHNDPHDRLAALLSLAGRHGIGANHLPYATGLSPMAATGAADRLVATGRAVAASTPPIYFDAALLPPLTDRLTALLTRLHEERPFAPVVSRQELTHALHLPDPALLEAVATAGTAVITETAGLRLHDHRVEVTGETARLRDHLLARLSDTPYTPPATSELAEQLDVAPDDLEPLLAHLARTGEVVRIGDRYYLPTAVAAVEAGVRTHLAAHPDLTVADFKSLFGLTRRHAIPLLEHLDRTSVTRREGKVRTAVGNGQ